MSGSSLRTPATKPRIAALPRRSPLGWWSTKSSAKSSSSAACFGDLAGTTLLVGTHSDVKGPNTDPARHMVSLASDDIQADFRRLKAAGVEFVEEPTQLGELFIATLKDPEGNLVQLLQR